MKRRHRAEPWLRSKFALYSLRNRLLLHERCSITEVAYALGFASSQHFATVFKRHTGKSPRKWRSNAIPGSRQS